MPQNKNTAATPAAPVLIVNGFSFFPLFGLPTEYCRSVYRRQGREVRKISWTMECMADVTAYAQAISRWTAAVRSETGRLKVCLVGWSMGGIACLYALKYLGLNTLVDALVTFGSPFSGAAISYPGMLTGFYTRTAFQLRPGSRFLKALTGGGLPSGVRLVSIGGDQDFICPPSSTFLIGADNAVGPYGHGDFLIKAQLHRMIADRLP